MALEANPQGPRRNSTGPVSSAPTDPFTLFLSSPFYDRVLACSDTDRLPLKVITAGPRCSPEEPSDKKPRLNANAPARP